MAVLFRYELKKLFSRKIIWVALVFFLAISLWGNWFMVTERLDGKVAGMRDTYRSFEGRIRTDAVSKDAKAKLNQFVAANPDHFDSFSSDDGTLVYYSKGFSDYYAGVSQGYMDVVQGETVEARQQRAATVQKYLDDGRYGDGKPLSQIDRENDKRAILASKEPPVIHYAEGWRLLSAYSQSCGIFVLLLLVLGLIPLFAGESTAKMESILLCSAKRQHTAIAKLFMAICYAIVLTILLYGEQVLIVAMTYGLDGIFLSASILNGWIAYLPGETIGHVYMKVGLITIAAMAACAAVVALASSLFRHPLPSLMGSVVLIAVQYIPNAVSRNSYMWNLGFLDNPPWYYLAQFTRLLPVVAVSDSYRLIYVLSNPYSVLIGLMLSLFITVVLAWFAQKNFLKQRKA